MIHEHTHSDDGERLMLLALSIFPQVIRFFNLKEEVRAVIIKDIPAAVDDGLTVLIESGLYKVVLGGEDVQRAIDVMEFKGRLLKEEGSLLFGSELGTGIKDPGKYKAGKDIVQIVFEPILFFNRVTDLFEA
jgi:hypothetical protein